MTYKNISIYVFFSLYFVAQSISNYIIDDATNTATPLDACIAEETHSVIYSCLGTTDSVFKYYYPNDTDCSSSHPIITSLDHLPTSQFHCGGSTNYILETYYQNEEECSAASAYYLPNITKTVYIATDVCFYDNVHNKYAKYSCTALFGQAVYFDDYLSCSTYDDPFYEQSFSNLSTSDTTVNISFLEYTSSTLCSSHSPFDAFPHHSLSACVINGIPETISYAPSLFFTYYGLTVYHRIALIDFFISTTDFGHHLWDANCSTVYYDLNVGITRWNLYSLAIDGDLWFYDDDNPFCGLYVDTYGSGLEYIDIRSSYANLTGNIPQTLCYLQHRLLSIRITSAPHLYGYIPECITTYHPYLNFLLFYDTSLRNIPRGVGDMPYLQDIWLLNNPFMNDTIPESMCNLITGPYYLTIMLSNVPIYGTIPDCLFEENYPYAATGKIITLEGTNINDTFPVSWCNLTSAHYTIFQLINNPFITGSIPECFAPYSIEMREMNGLSGTVPDSVLCVDGHSIIFENNTNFEESTLPECLSDLNPWLYYLILYNSSFVGRFPTLPSNSSLTYINIANNQFTGSLTDIIDFSIDDVSYFMAHKNNFHDDDISSLLEYLLDETNITILSISDNPQIHGTIPDDIYNTQLHTFLAHNCDLHGVLPQRSHFEALTTITLYGNRLSGRLPTEIHIPFNITSVVLLDNLLSTPGHNELPSWVNSPFSTAPNLYISNYRQNMGIFVICMCFSAVLIVFARTLYKFIEAIYMKRAAMNAEPQPSPTASPRSSPHSIKAIKKIAIDDEYGFFDNIEFVLKSIADFRLLCFLIILMIFYSVAPHYYHVITIESLFTLSWYHAHDAHHQWMDWILFLLAIVLQLLLCGIILHLNLEQIHLKQSKTLKSIEIRTQQELVKAQTLDLYRTYSSRSSKATAGSLSVQSTNSPRKPTSPLEITDIIDHQMKMSCNIRTRMRYKYALRILLIALYFMFYFVGIALVILYVVARALPEKNLLHLNSSGSILLTQSIGLIMFINNRYITLGLVNTIASINDFVYFYRAEVALFLRVNNVIIIPFIASVFLLNDCGKYWIHLWDYCSDDELKSEFDFHTVIDYGAESQCVQTCDTHIQLLSPADVCYNPSISAMDPNKCVRGFFYQWTFAIMMKLIFSILASLVAFGIRLLRLKIKRLPTKNKLYIEGYYTSMITSLTTSVSFVFVAPLILPLNIMQILLRTYLYRINIYKFGFKLCTINTRNVKVHKTKQSLPIYFLWIGIAIGQSLAALFLRYALDDVLLATFYVVAIFIIDIYCCVVIKKRKAGFKKTREDHKRTITQENVSRMSSNQIYSVPVPSSKGNLVRSATSSPLSDVVADIDSEYKMTAFDFRLNDANEILHEAPITEENVSHVNDLSLRANHGLSNEEIPQIMDEIQNGKDEDRRDSLEIIQHLYLAAEINKVEDKEDGVQPTIKFGEKSNDKYQL